VTRADIQAKIDEIRGFAERSVATGSDQTRGALIGGVALALAVAYLWGRWRGRRRRTVVEVRRI
jgi:hypothetical protein